MSHPSKPITFTLSLKEAESLSVTHIRPRIENWDDLGAFEAMDHYDDLDQNGVIAKADEYFHQLKKANVFYFTDQLHQILFAKVLDANGHTAHRLWSIARIEEGFGDGYAVLTDYSGE